MWGKKDLALSQVQADHSVGIHFYHELTECQLFYRTPTGFVIKFKNFNFDKVLVMSVTPKSWLYLVIPFGHRQPNLFDPE